MAKSIRSSTKKRNHAKLRSTVFGPVVDARTERLSAKLQELAAQPLKIETSKDNTEENSKTEAEAEDESDSKRINPISRTCLEDYVCYGFKLTLNQRNGH
jgi:hypothetical protein